MMRITFPMLLLLAANTALAQANDPRGAWQRACWTGELDLLATETMTYDAAQQVHVQRDYTVQDQCGHPDFTLNLRGGYRVGNPSQAVAGAHDIDLTWREVTLTPLHVEAANAFNELAVCGYRDWVANTARDVSGRTCQGLTPPTVGSTLYQIFKIEGGRYTAGDFSQAATNGSTPALRPRTLQSNLPHERVEGAE